MWYNKKNLIQFCIKYLKLTKVIAVFNDTIIQSIGKFNIIFQFETNYNFYIVIAFKMCCIRL